MLINEQGNKRDENFIGVLVVIVISGFGSFEFLLSSYQQATTGAWILFVFGFAALLVSAGAAGFAAMFAVNYVIRRIREG